jgi:hypothetical protein
MRNGLANERMHRHVPLEGRLEAKHLHLRCHHKLLCLILRQVAVVCEEEACESEILRLAHAREERVRGLDEVVGALDDNLALGRVWRVSAKGRDFRESAVRDGRENTMNARKMAWRC